MDLRDKRLVIGGAGLIGSNTVDALLDEPVAEIRVFDHQDEVAQRRQEVQNRAA